MGTRIKVTVDLAYAPITVHCYADESDEQPCWGPVMMIGDLYENSPRCQGHIRTDYTPPPNAGRSLVARDFFGGDLGFVDIESHYEDQVWVNPRNEIRKLLKHHYENCYLMHKVNYASMYFKRGSIVCVCGLQVKVKDMK